MHSQQNVKFYCQYVSKINTKRENLTRATESRFGPLNKGRLAKNIYIKSERLPQLQIALGLVWELICTIDKQYYQKVENNMQHSEVLGPLLDCWVQIICTGFSPTSHLVSTELNTNLDLDLQFMANNFT